MSSFGETLKRERELRQISLREISEATKISLRYLDALEKDDFRHLPGGVFNKGFVKAYAQFIGIDPEAMAMAYLEEERRQSASAPKPPGMEGATSASREPRPVSGLRYWIAALIVVLVLLALAAALTALGYGPLASRFRGLRSEAPAATSRTTWGSA
jgi:cytoskeletal protein RodZ